MFDNSFDEKCNEAEEKKCESIAVRYISYKSRTEKEVFDKLMSYNEFDNQTISGVIERLKDYGYIDDKKYAEYFVMVKTESKLDGPYKIREALKKRGISGKIADEAIENYKESATASDAENASYLIEKKLANVFEADEKSKRRVFNYLFRKGFSTQAIIEGFKIAGGQIDIDEYE